MMHFYHVAILTKKNLLIKNEINLQNKNDCNSKKSFSGERTNSLYEQLSKFPQFGLVAVLPPARRSPHVCHLVF